jgi:hypothetical protein
LFARIATLSLAGLVAAACGDAVDPGADETPALAVEDREGIVLMTQTVVPLVAMDALYEGRVVADEKGCLRLDTPTASAVVWPYGYDVESRDDGIVVVDGEGAEVGTVGGGFSLAGGEVSELSDAMGFTSEDRSRAAASCPGRYWIGR